jgi:predicted kinase
MADILLCYFLIGLPGSGKSTLAQQLASKKRNLQIISTDQIRETCYGNAATQGVWTEIESVVLSQISQAIAQGTPVIYDATNCNRTDRIALLQKIGKPTFAQWIALHLQTSVSLCKQRNRQRDRQVPEEIIEKMAKQLQTEPPTCVEGFRQIVKILPDTIEHPGRSTEILRFL